MIGYILWTQESVVRCVTMGCCCSRVDGSQVASDDLQEAISTEKCDARIVLLKTDAELEAATRCVTLSFNGSMNSAPEGGIDWIIGPLYKEMWDDRERISYVSWISFCILRATDWYGGSVVGILDDETKELAAICAVRPPGTLRDGKAFPNQFCNLFRLYTTLDESGKKRLDEPWKASSWKDAGGLERRMKTFEDTLGRMHSENARGDHWYVQIMGVHPGFQVRICTLPHQVQ